MNVAAKPDGRGNAREPKRADAQPDAKPAARTPLERKKAERRQRYRRKRRIIRTGQVLMAVAAVMALLHLLAHLGTFGGQPSGFVDLVAGYPAAAVLFLAGAVAAGQ
ncbi:hypothetical protein FDG2_5941 [Candidatus Protofrankia californiensis]|uniref:Uncharacterized protein n=1 Tax=Candidatus Protofrankia californiensis TaxID=1839754 RepID=A0A1C3PG56_9ACTN|nr:hypothetical protein FDG2_5941 [Candidatus Protofrankia californiensis]